MQVSGFVITGSIIGILDNENAYLRTYCELVRSGGNAGSFDYFVPRGIFGTPSIRIYLRLLKLEVTCQKEIYV